MSILNNQPAHSGNFAGSNGITNIIDSLVALTGVSPVTYNQEEAQNILNRSTPITGHMVASDGQVYNVVDIIQAIAGGNINYDRIVQKAIDMPLAGEDTNLMVILYQGPTNTTYTHGYIYECQKTATYSSTVTFDPADISCDGDDFAAFVGSIYSDPEDIVSGSMTYIADADLWVFVGKDSNGNTLVTYQQYTEDFTNAGFTMPENPEDGDVVNFECSVTESSATYAWVHLSV